MGEGRVMKASLGDRIVVRPTREGGRVQLGRIVELRHPDGSPPYVVRWDDTGERALFFPGTDSRLLPDSPTGADALGVTDALDLTAGAASTSTGHRHRVRTWTVGIDLVETGTETTARAVLHSDTGAALDAPHGRAMKSPHDDDSPGIGDDVAVARALRHLSDRLLSRAEGAMSVIEERDITVSH